MTLWDWLATPQGVEAAHALIVLVAAVAAILSAWATRIARHNRRLLNGHLKAHLAKLDAEQLARGPRQVQDE